MLADYHYKAGCCYYNPEDPNMCVPKRFGFGWTANWAHRGAVAAMILLIVASIAVAIIVPVVIATSQ